MPPVIRQAHFSTSLVRGLSILECFGLEYRLLGIADISERVQMNRSTVHRYVTTLTSLGYLEQDRSTRKYQLGLRVMDLGLAAVNSSELRDVARPDLEALSDRSGHTVNLAILSGSEIVYVDRIRNPNGIDLNLSVGSRLPAYCTSMGKVLLAGIPPEDLSRHLDGTELLQRGPNTLTNRAVLLDELEKVRQTGIAINNEELAFGLRSIAAPVRNSEGAVVASVNIAVHASNYSLDQVRDNLGPMLVDTTETISAKLGHRRSTVRPSAHRRVSGEVEHAERPEAP